MTDALGTLRARLGSSDEEERRQALVDPEIPRTAEALALLVDAMGDPSWRVRKDAVAQVAAWPEATVAVNALVRIIEDDSDVGRRNAAVEALWAIGPPAVPGLARALARETEHRKFFIDALAGIKDRSAVPALVARLDDSDENVRAAAAEALGQIGGDEAASALRGRLARATLLEKLAVLEALQRMEAPVPVGELKPLLAQPILRRAALRLLGYAGDASVLDDVLEALSDGGRGVKEAAAGALVALAARLPDDHARQALAGRVRGLPEKTSSAMIAGASADDPEVRRACLTLLGWARSAGALPRLVDALSDEEVSDVAARAIVAYGPDGVGPLVELSREQSESLKADIFRILPLMSGEAQRDEVVKELCQALEESGDEAATAAAEALGKLGRKSALAPLFHAIERHDDPAVRRVAAASLAALGKEHYDEVRMLIVARGLDDEELGVLLCRILAQIGKPQDQPLLLAALKSEDPRLREAAASALAAPGPADESVEALSFALADESPAVRAAAATTLAQLGDRRATRSLVTATADEEERVALAAVRALGELGDPEGAPVLRTLVESPTPPVALAAVESLGKLPAGDPADDAALQKALGAGDTEIVKAALTALAVRRAGAESLLPALEHRAWDVRRRAAELLADRAGEAGVKERLEGRAAVEEDPLVKEALEAALGAR